MTITASVTNGVLRLTGAQAGNVIISFDYAGLVTITEGGNIVAISGGDQPVTSIDPAAVSSSSYTVTVLGTSLGDTFKTAQGSSVAASLSTEGAAMMLSFCWKTRSVLIPTISG